MIEFLIK